MDRGRSHKSIKPKNTRNRWETKVWRRIEVWRNFGFSRCRRIDEALCKLIFFLLHVMNLLSPINQYMRSFCFFLNAWVITPTCHLLIQANLKCQISQISPLAFKLTNSGPIIGIFNFIPIGPLYFQSYKYISGFLKWVPNSPQNHFFWICAPRSHQILAQTLFPTDLIITFSQLFQNIITFIKRRILI